MPASDGGDVFGGIGGPFEGFGMGVVVFEEVVDGFWEAGHRAEDAALEPASGEDGEEAFDGDEPGGGTLCELEGPARMTREPPAHVGMLESGAIVEACVDGLAGGNLTLDGIEEADELLVAVALHVAADHHSIEGVHGG